MFLLLLLLFRLRFGEREAQLKFSFSLSNKNFSHWFVQITVCGIVFKTVGSERGVAKEWEKEVEREGVERERQLINLNNRLRQPFAGCKYFQLFMLTTLWPSGKVASTPAAATFCFPLPFPLPPWHCSNSLLGAKVCAAEAFIIMQHFCAAAAQ